MKVMTKNVDELKEEEYFLFGDRKYELKQEILNNMKTLDTLDPLSQEHHSILLRTIDHLYSYGFYSDINELKPIEFYKKYDSYLSDSEVVSAYFSLNKYNLALEYINFNYERLKRGFREGYVAFGSIDDEGEFGIPEKFEYSLAIREVYGEHVKNSNIHILSLGYNERILNYLLYKYFFDDISFIFLHAKTDNDKLFGFCHSLDWRFLKEILQDYYNKKDFKTYNEIIRKYVSKSITIMELIPLLERPFEDINFLYQAYEESMVFEKRLPISSGFSTLENLNRYEKNIRESLKSSEKQSTMLISNDFYANLKYLKTFPKCERVKTSVYKECFKIFYEFLKNYYMFDISEYIYMFERLFNRVIEGDSLTEFLKFTNIESIYHYFKSGECVNLNTDLVSMEDIKSYNTKQFYEIRKLFYSSIMAILFYDEHNFTEDTISILTFFGYDYAKKLLLLKTPRLLLTETSKHKFKNEEAKNKFIKIIFNEILKSEVSQGEIGKILRIFDYLYACGYKNITLSKIIKRINSFEYVLLPNNYNIKDNLSELDKVSKGEPLEEKINAITLYNEYRLRSVSSIPDLKGNFKNLTYETVDIHSPEIISNGIGAYLHSNGETSSSCLTPAGKAASCLKHGASSPHGRFFKVMINGYILAYSWIWRAGNTLCFDNIEVTDEIKKNNIDENTIIELYKKAGSEFLNITQENEETPLEVILIGKNKLDVIQAPFNDLPKTTKQIKPNNNEELYLKDSEEGEYILIGDETSINTNEVTPQYKYKRKPVSKFSSFSNDELCQKLNSIYFDYCIFKNEKYVPMKNIYEYGYIGEDWFVGYLSDGTEEFYYRTNNPDTINEASKYLNKKVDIKIDIPIIKGNYDELEYFLNSNNYHYKEDEVLEYLKSIEEYLKTITTKDYYHSPGNMKNLSHILYDGAITSSLYGNHPGGGGSNGGHFICVAELSSNLYRSFAKSNGFVIDENICTFETGVDSKLDFNKSRYPIRTSGGAGEKQVLDYIPLSKVKAINLHKDLDIGIAYYLEEHLGLDIPIIYSESYKLVDKNEIKHLIKLK